MTDACLFGLCCGQMLHALPAGIVLGTIFSRMPCLQEPVSSPDDEVDKPAETEDGATNAADEDLEDDEEGDDGASGDEAEGSGESKSGKSSGGYGATNGTR